MATQTKNTSMKKAIHTVIGLAIIFFFGFIPAPAPITPFGMKTLGLFIGTVYLWISVDLLWPSLFAVVMYSVIGYTNISGAVAMSLGNDTFWQAILMMAVLGVMGESGVIDHVVSAMMGMKILKGRPWLFSFVFFLIIVIACILTTSLLAVLLSFQMLTSVRDASGLKNGDKYLHLMAIGGVFIGAMGGCIVPFRGLMLYLINILARSGFTGLDFLSFMLMSIPTVLMFIVVFLLMMRFIFRCDVSKIRDFDPTIFKKNLGPLNKRQISLIAVFAAYLLTLTFAPYLPKGSWLAELYSKAGVAGTAIVLFCLCHIIHVDGKPIGNFQQVVHTIPWGMMFMIAVAMSISNVLLSDDGGIKQWMMVNLQPLFAGKSPIVFSAMFVAIAIILTNVSNNMVVAFIFVPLAIAFNSIEPIALFTTVSLLCFAVNFALVLPSGSPTAAMLFSHEFIDNKRGRHFLYTITTCVLGFLVMMLVSYPLGMFFMGN